MLAGPEASIDASSVFIGSSGAGDRRNPLWNKLQKGSGALRHQPVLGAPVAERNRESDSPAALPMGGKRPFSLETELPWVLARMAAEPDISLRALLTELRERGVHVSYYAVWHIVRRSGLTTRKTLHASEQDRPDVVRRRMLWKRYQHRVDPGRLIFVDG